MITASLKNYRISPRKVRVVADMIRGKGVAQADIILTNVSKKAKSPLRDLLASALANASHNHKIDTNNLVVKEIRVDQGYVLHRYRPMAHGSAFPIKKRTSHVSLVLAPREEAKKKEESSRKKGETAPVAKARSKKVASSK